VTTLDILQDVRTLLSSPDKWAQRTHAQDKNGRPVPFDDSRACSWCLVGAAAFAARRVDRMGFGLTVQELATTLDIWGEGRSPNSVAIYNDDVHRTHAEVMRLLDTTIARLEHDQRRPQSYP
jgi:hypothetical protein